ncbi:MAG: pyruvate kinase [Anaerofustis sp.]
MKRTKVVCTLGPATDDESVLETIILAGMDVARLNFSHGTHEEQQKRVDAVKKLRDKHNKPVALMLDTKGPEIRIKQFAKGSILLAAGDSFTLRCDDVVGDETKVSVTYPNLCREIRSGTTILIDDGLIQLIVKEIKDTEIRCIVQNGGELKNNKSLNIPDAKIQLPSLTDKDISDLKFAIENEMDFIAASFVRNADDVLTMRGVLEENGGSNIKIISKIENREGVNNIDSILDLCDGIMVARGDLGVEIPAEEVPIVQKHIIRKCNSAGKPVITATQMLDSMIRNPRPTRAEVGDVANAIFDGTDAVMLSGETAAGKYPTEAVETMVRISLMAESNLETDAHFSKKFKGETTVTNTIGYTSCAAAEALSAKAIFTPTSSGYTARTISKFRPNARIIAVMDKPWVQRQLSLSWGVESILLPECNVFEQLLHDSLIIATERRYVNEGDLVVITAGLPINVAGTTNMIRVETVGHYVLRGKGIGKGRVRGVLRIVRDCGDVTLNEHEIIAVDCMNERIAEQLHMAGGLLTTQKGLSSPCAVAAIRAEIPAITGLSDIDSFPEGSVVELDPHRNMVYRVADGGGQ